MIYQYGPFRLSDSRLAGPEWIRAITYDIKYINDNYIANGDATIAPTANKIVKRNGDGDINAHALSCTEIYTDSSTFRIIPNGGSGTIWLAGAFIDGRDGRMGVGALQVGSDSLEGGTDLGVTTGNIICSVGNIRATAGCVDASSIHCAEIQARKTVNGDPDDTSDYGPLIITVGNSENIQIRNTDDTVTFVLSTDSIANPNLNVSGSIGGNSYFLQPSSEPQDQDSDTDARIYLSGSNLVVKYNDGGTMRYKYLDLSGTGVTWVHSLTSPTSPP